MLRIASGRWPKTSTEPEPMAVSIELSASERGSVLQIHRDGVRFDAPWAFLVTYLVKLPTRGLERSRFAADASRAVDQAFDVVELR